MNDRYEYLVGNKYKIIFDDKEEAEAFEKAMKQKAEELDKEYRNIRNYPLIGIGIGLLPAIGASILGKTTGISKEIPKFHGIIGLTGLALAGLGYLAGKDLQQKKLLEANSRLEDYAINWALSRAE
ncbi:MAG: hypothetical protein DSY42_00295 [Aquifex sp.]|nr:MAG: hypothetical protein DSY42_00295 [Aquifex sp.]